jgi:hypothetical protein
MKSTSEPLEVHHASQIKNELHHFIADKSHREASDSTTSKKEIKNSVKNYSDTDAVLIKGLSRNNQKPSSSSSSTASTTSYAENQSYTAGEQTENAPTSSSSANYTTTLHDNTDTTNFLLKNSNLESKHRNSCKFLSPQLSRVTSRIYSKGSATGVSDTSKTEPSKIEGKLGMYDLSLNTYSKKTLLGNWVEERIFEKVEQDKCDEKQCLYKSLCIPKEFFEQPASLSGTFTNTINFMDKIIFKSDGNKPTRCGSFSEPRCDSYLQLDYTTDKRIDGIEFTNEYPVNCRTIVKENLSMVFRIEALDRRFNENKSQIYYGQHFYISTLEGGYYLYSENHLSKRTKFTNLSPVFFTKFDSVYSNTNFKWMFLPLVGNLAFEYDGKPVNINSCALLKHVNTGRYLIICDQMRFNKRDIYSFYEIACDSLISKKYFYTYNNFWRILKAPFNC